MAQAPKVSADRASFVRDIVSDPKSVPDVMLLYGYLGASSEEGHERLYLSPDLTNYVEVPTAAILHQMAAPKEQDPHGGVTLWVKKDAALVYKMAPAAEALAHYFAGAIAGGAAPGPQPAALGAPNFAVQTLHPHVCTVQCNTRYPYCGTVTPACSYGASCWCLPPAAAAMAAAGPQPAALDAPNFGAQTLHPHVCTVQCNTRYPYCGTVTPACSYGASCWCLPPAAAAMAAAGPQLAAAAGPAAVSVGTSPPHVCRGELTSRHASTLHAVTCAAGCTLGCHPSPAPICGQPNTWIGCGHSIVCNTPACFPNVQPQTSSGDDSATVRRWHGRARADHSLLAYCVRKHMSSINAERTIRRAAPYSRTTRYAVR